MARLHSHVRYRLKRAPQGQAATPSNDGLTWLAAHNPAWIRWQAKEVNIEAIARSAKINPVSLLKTKQGDNEISQRMMAALVWVSGEPHDVAFSAMFELVHDDALSGAAA